MVNELNMRIGIDYDKTLDDIEVQKIVKELIVYGHQLYIITKRKECLNIKGFDSNKLLYELCFKLGIVYDNIFFTGGCSKLDKVKKLNLDIFLDNNNLTVIEINMNSNCTAILFDSSNNWKLFLSKYFNFVLQ